MEKRIFHKILTMTGVLSVGDLTPEQKRALTAIMVKNGATGGFTYDRFFQKGFLPWELEGISNIKREFLKAHEREMLDQPESDPGYSFALSIDDSKGGFYRAIGQTKGLITKLKEYMSDRGMKSPVTVINRFNADDWKPYEVRGVADIIKEFMDSYGNVPMETAAGARRYEPVAAAAGGI